MFDVHFFQSHLSKNKLALTGQGEGKMIFTIPYHYVNMVENNNTVSLMVFPQYFEFDVMSK